MLDLSELKKLHDKAYTYSQVTRERAADDLVFYWITHWDDNLLSESPLAYRGEFDVLRKAGRGILADLAANPVQVDFEPINETREDSSEILDGLYRSDDNHNQTLNAYEVAQQESVVAGVGAWEIYTEYVSYRTPDKNQVVRRRPLHEANNCVYFDPNAKLLDKSDARYCSVLTAYSEDGYKDLVYDLTGEELSEGYAESFKQPEQSYAFPWLGSGGKHIYIVSFYYRELVKTKVLIMSDPFGQEMQVRESSLEKVMDELIDLGFSITGEKEIKRYQVTKYIASGAEILSTNVIAGEYIPVVPVYGEHAYVEGEEHYEGVTRLAKDPQRLRDFQLSYLADIVSRSPRNKPIFLAEQVAGFQDMYSESGADNFFPYLFQNRLAGDGTELPLGPVGVMPEQTMPVALMTSIELSKEAILDVANPGIPQDIADPDLSGKAILALQNRIDMQSAVYQEHMKHAKRRDAEVYASIASEIYDVPRRVKLTLPDGTTKDSMVMQSVIDRQTGDVVILNDLVNAEFEVYSKIGPSYHSQKEQTVERLAEMVASMEQNSPMRQALMLKMLQLMDGVEFDDIREYANVQLILSGVKKPETEEEVKLLKQAQMQKKEPSAEMVLAQAEMLKGQADQMREKREMIKLQLNMQNEQMKREIDMFEAQTDRMDTQIDAQKAGAEIDYKRVDTFGKKLENTEKIIELQSPKRMTNRELFQSLATG